MYQKYLNAEGDDKFDYIDSLANRYGHMVIAFQDIMATIGKTEGSIKRQRISASAGRTQNFRACLKKRAINKAGVRTAI